MKIYIENYNIEKLSKKLKTLHEYFINKTNILEVYTDEGIFSIDQNNIYKHEYFDKPVKNIKKYIDDFSVIVDTTNFKKSIVNQLPSDNLIIKIETRMYQISSKSSLRLIINFIQNKQSEYKLYDWYFDVSDDIDINNLLFKEDINVFLSSLN